MREALLGALLAAVVVAAGCVTGPAAGVSRAPPEEGVDIRVAMIPLNARLAWIVTLHDNGTRSYPDALVKFSVEKRGGVPAGEDQASADIQPGNDTSVRFVTPNLGFGDYFYHVVVEDGAGRILGETRGMAEHCVC